MRVSEIFYVVWGMAFVFSHWARQLKKRLDDFLVSFTVICWRTFAVFWQQTMNRNIHLFKLSESHNSIPLGIAFPAICKS